MSLRRSTDTFKASKAFYGVQYGVSVFTSTDSLPLGADSPLRFRPFLRTPDLGCLESALWKAQVLMRPSVLPARLL